MKDTHRRPEAQVVAVLKAFGGAIAALAAGLAFLGLGILSFTTTPFAIVSVSAAVVLLTFAGVAGALASRAWTGAEAAWDEAARLRSLLETGPDWLTRMNGEGRFTFVSGFSRSALGYAPYALVGRPVQAVVHPDDLAGLEDLLGEMRSGRKDALAELRLRHSNGRFVWFELKAVCDPEAEGPLEITLSWRRVQERKHLETSLREARDVAEAANLAKTRFLASVSHELRTPLNAIIGFSEVMREQMFGPLGARRYEEYADYIHESGRHLLDLINDILDMSKIEAGRYEIHKETVRMPLVIERSLKTISFAARQGGVRLDVDLPGDLSPIEADQRAMRQILLNLLSNAVKFTPRGGLVSIRVRTTKEQMILDVRDTGIGIPKDAIGRLGRPFEQVHRPIGFDGEPAETPDRLSASLPGTGLGLAIVKALVGLHRGSMTIDSEEGQGTLVRVCLPLGETGRGTADEAEAA